MTDISLISNGLSLEDVFAQKASSCSRSCKIRLTPRSKQAVLIHGIDPAVLVERDFKSFFERGQDPQIQTMKYEIYFHTREKLYRVALDERSKLATKARNCSFSSTCDSSTVSRASTISIDRKVSTLIENEKARLEKVQQINAKEIMRMIAFEKKSKEINEKISAKAEEDAKKDDQRKKGKRIRELQAAEEARIRELRRRAREDVEASLQRIKINEQFERERIMRDRKVSDEREIKKRALLDEQHRIQKRQAHQQLTKEKQEQRRRETEKRIKEREAKELEREAKLELKRLVDVQAAEKKRRDSTYRIERNQKAANERREDKRKELLLKKARHDAFIGRIQIEKNAQFAERQQQREFLDKKRKYQLKKTKEKDLATKRAFLSKIEQDEAHLKVLADQRRKEEILLKAEKDLQLQMKKDNLERIKKAQQYQLRQTMQKADANDQRCQDLKKRKEDLVKVRQKNAHEAKVKKDRLVAMLEQSKSASTGSSGLKKLLRSVSSDTGLVTSQPCRKQIANQT